MALERFSDVDAVLAAFGIKNLSALIAGAIGGAVSLRHYTDLTMKGKCAVLASSMAIANYGTLPVAHWFGGRALDHQEAIAWCLGLFGLSMVSAVIGLIKSTDWDTVRGFFGGGGK